MGILQQPSLIQDIRNYIRDKTELNRLINGRETGDNTIGLCIEAATERWNSNPPFGVSTITITTSGTININNVDTPLKIISYPANAKWILIKGAIVEIIKSVSMLRSRNTLAYSDGNIQVRDEEAALQNYISMMLPIFEQEFMRMMTQYKTTANLNQMMDSSGGVGSDYSWFPDYRIWENYTYYP